MYKAIITMAGMPFHIETVSEGLARDIIRIVADNYANTHLTAGELRTYTKLRVDKPDESLSYIAVKMNVTFAVTEMIYRTLHLSEPYEGTA